MRNLLRVKTTIISACALVVALGLTPAAGLVGSSAGVAVASCSGQSCNGVYPGQTNCWNDATVIARQDTDSGVEYVDYWHSAACNAVWPRINVYSGWPAGYLYTDSQDTSTGGDFPSTSTGKVSTWTGRMVSASQGYYLMGCGYVSSADCASGLQQL
jgi:hypothetical protein